MLTRTLYLNSFKEWVSRQPSDEHYDEGDQENCAIAQWARKQWPEADYIYASYTDVIIDEQEFRLVPDPRADLDVKELYVAREGSSYNELYYAVHESETFGQLHNRLRDIHL